ncbi:MAG: amino acid adenylation domain-containing protein [Synechococcales bacterium]|nr:amino acid adenylation domain-containing protein [Synechococcales bacterium]
MDKRKNIENIYPLSPMQQGILFHTLLAPESGIYVPQIVLTLEGALDAIALRRVWQQAVARHDVLRTAFYWKQRDEPFQVVYRQAELLWVQQDWRDQPPELQTTHLQVFLDCNQTQPFNLHTPPLLRLALIQVGNHKHHLVCAYHHLILDGWSAANLLKTIFTQYLSMIMSPDKGTQPCAPTHPSTHPPTHPSTPYTTYITWLQSQNPTAAQTFWQTYLQGFQEPSYLPIWTTSSSKSHIADEQRTEQQRLLSTKQTVQLRTFAQQHQLTLNTLIQGAFGLLLSRYCDQNDIVFGATCAGRPPSIPGSETMVGLFINTLPVRMKVPEDAEVVPWLRQLQGDRATTTAYEYSSLMDVQAWSELPAGHSLFDCLLVVENYPVNADMLTGQTTLTLTDVRFIEWTHFPLTLLVSTGERLSLTAKYSRKRITDDAIHRLLAHLETLLMGLTTHRTIQDVPLLTPAEQEQIHLWNQTATDYPLDHTLTELIEAQVEETPDAIAVIFKDETLTYSDLNTKANQLARHLQSLGVGTEIPVAVCVERSPDLVIALLAILKVGGAYLPIDPEYPQERITWMLQDATPPILFTHNPTAHHFTRLTHSPQQLNLNTLHPNVQTPQHSNVPIPPSPHPPTPISPHNPISLLYTSGSTGRPKGVVNTHRGLVNRLCWMQDAYPLTAADRVLQKTPLSFDVSAWELFWPLMTGACLVLAKPAGHKDSAYLVELIQQQHITTLHFVPTMLAAFLEVPDVVQCTNLKRVICSGEALPACLQTQFFQTLPNVELHNLYGPTEAAIDVTAWTCQPSFDAPPTATVPIGRPIANTQIYLLDSRDRPVPPGIPGELHISGVGLARGYWHRPDLTAEKFVPNSFVDFGLPILDFGLGIHAQSNPKSKTQNPKWNCLYKTGDRARYRPDGTLEFLGRIDHQVKLRGFRIELGEIEAILVQHPDIFQAVVLLRQDTPTNPQLVAYIVLNPKSKIQNPKFKDFLSTHLPPYMVPTQFMTLAALPLLPNGKINRKALPAPDRPEKPFARSPQTTTELRIADIWQEVLRLPKVGAEDNFFELGGNSLSATRVNTRLQQAFELDIPLRVMFECSTVAELAVYIDAMQMTLSRTLNQPVAEASRRKEIEL